MNTHKFYELQFEIETNCLLNCVHCSSASTRGKARTYSDKDVLKYLELFQGPIHIYFTGGEPLLYEGFVPLCAQIHSAKPDAKIGLYSTGNCAGLLPISETLSASMRQLGIVDCFFSIYSDSQEEQDNWTNRVGSFQNTIASVKNLSSAGISPKAHLVLTRENHHKITSLIEFCQAIGIEEVRILRLVPFGNAKANWEKISVSLERQNELIRQLIRMQDTYSVRLTFSGYPELHPCRATLNAYKCQAGTNLLYTDAQGDIYPCACTKQDTAKHRICNITDLDQISEYLHNSAHESYHLMCLNKE